MDVNQPQPHRWPLPARRGSRRAGVAVARSLLEIVYYLPLRRDCYWVFGAAYFAQLDRERTTRRLVSRFERPGYTVGLTTSPPLAASSALAA